MKATLLTAVCAAMVLAIAVASPAQEVLIFEETFDTNAAAEFYSTDPTNYGDWSLLNRVGSTTAVREWSVQNSKLQMDIVTEGTNNGASVVRNIAIRTGKRLDWDADWMRFANDEAANKLVKEEYRSGWSL